MAAAVEPWDNSEQWEKSTGSRHRSWRVEMETCRESRGCIQSDGKQMVWLAEHDSLGGCWEGPDRPAGSAAAAAAAAADTC